MTDQTSDDAGACTASDADAIAAAKKIARAAWQGSTDSTVEQLLAARLTLPACCIAHLGVAVTAMCVLMGTRIRGLAGGGCPVHGDASHLMFMPGASRVPSELVVMRAVAAAANGAFPDVAEHLASYVAGAGGGREQGMRRAAEVAAVALTVMFSATSCEGATRVPEHLA